MRHDSQASQLLPKEEGLYKVDTQHPESTSVSLTDASISITDAHHWLGHVSPDTVSTALLKWAHYRASPYGRTWRLPHATPVHMRR